MRLTLPLTGESATRRIGAALAALLRAGDAVLLEGPLGAGKTTFARALLRAACHEPGLEVPSPTYTLRQDYESLHGTLAHFDLWRLDGPAALDELGWHDALRGIVLVEWPDRLGDARPRGALTVSFDLDVTGIHPDHRRVRLEGWPAERPRRLGTLGATTP